MLVEGLRRVLGSDLVGAYLHGSAVLGGLRPDSDLDVLVVSARPTSAGEKRQLVDFLLSRSGRPRPIELDLVVESELRPWRYPPPFDFHYSERWRGPFERGELEPWARRTNPDLASALTTARCGDTSLAGPPPAQVLPAVPRRDYVDSVLRDLDIVDELPGNTRNVVLTLPRIWSALATDDVHSKESAADWALPRLPAEHRAVLEHARSAYRGEAADSWDDAQVRAFAGYVVAEIERLTGGSRPPSRSPAP